MSPSAAVNRCLHPELDAIIARIGKHGMVAGLITNGYFLIQRIQRLNRVGLEWLQISLTT